MSTRRMRKVKRRRSAQSAGEMARRFLAGLAARSGCPEQEKLVELWRNWSAIMGPDIAALGEPMGHSGKRLLVGTDDSMAMQELSYLRADILERANAFMEEPFFSEVRFSLQGQGKTLSGSGESSAPPGEKPWSAARGTFLHLMDPDSPIARCYRAWSSLPDREEES